MSETVIKFMDKNKIKNSTVPGWVRLVKFNMEPAVGRFGFTLDQFTSSVFKSPSKIILGRVRK